MLMPAVRSRVPGRQYGPPLVDEIRRKAESHQAAMRTEGTGVDLSDPAWADASPTARRMYDAQVRLELGEALRSGEIRGDRPGMESVAPPSSTYVSPARPAADVDAGGGVLDFLVGGAAQGMQNIAKDSKALLSGEMDVHAPSRTTPWDVVNTVFALPDISDAARIGALAGAAYIKRNPKVAETALRAVLKSRLGRRVREDAYTLALGSGIGGAPSIDRFGLATFLNVDPLREGYLRRLDRLDDHPSVLRTAMRAVGAKEPGRELRDWFGPDFHRPEHAGNAGIPGPYDVAEPLQDKFAPDLEALVRDARKTEGPGFSPRVFSYRRRVPETSSAATWAGTVDLAGADPGGFMTRVRDGDVFYGDAYNFGDDYIKSRELHGKTVDVVDEDGEWTSKVIPDDPAPTVLAGVARRVLGNPIRSAIRDRTLDPLRASRIKERIAEEFDGDSAVKRMLRRGGVKALDLLGSPFVTYNTIPLRPIAEGGMPNWLMRQSDFDAHPKIFNEVERLALADDIANRRFERPADYITDLISASNASRSDFSRQRVGELVGPYLGFDPDLFSRFMSASHSGDTRVDNIFLSMAQGKHAKADFEEIDAFLGDLHKMGVNPTEYPEWPDPRTLPITEDWLPIYTGSRLENLARRLGSAQLTGLPNLGLYSPLGLEKTITSLHVDDVPDEAIEAAGALVEDRASSALFKDRGYTPSIYDVSDWDWEESHSPSYRALRMWVHQDPERVASVLKNTRLLNVRNAPIMDPLELAPGGALFSGMLFLR